jgi:hypothetical protein
MNLKNTNYRFQERVGEKCRQKRKGKKEKKKGRNKMQLVQLLMLRQLRYPLTSSSISLLPPLTAGTSRSKSRILHPVQHRSSD